MLSSLALAFWLAPLPQPRGPLPSPESAGSGALAQSSSGFPDRTRRFPLRREGGGTRGACAARLVAHLVPPDGRLDPGPQPILGVIEGQTPEPVPLVLRWPGGERTEPTQRSASLRLLRLPAATPPGLWESFPACEGSSEPQAPPARSLLGPAAGAPPGTAEQAARQALRDLWRRCGESVPTAALLATWDYPHLAALLPPTLPVLCSVATPAGG